MEYVLLEFLSKFCSKIVLVQFWQVHLYRYNTLLLSFDDINVRWFMVNNYICNRMFSKHVKKQKVSNFLLKLDEVRMRYRGLSATSERSTMPVSSVV